MSDIQRYYQAQNQLRGRGSKMPKIQEFPGSSIGETENIIQECRERIWQALEVDTNKLREKAEAESRQILNNAGQEAARIMAQATEKARIESEKFIARAKEEAAEIIRQSRAEAEKAQQELGRLIKERRLLSEVSQSIEQTIAETETHIKVNFERLAGIIAEAKSTLQTFNETQIEEAEVIASEEIGEPAVLEACSSEEDESSHPEERRSALKNSEDARLFRGRVKLEVIRPFDQERLAGIPEWLVKLKGLKVTSTGCYARANRWITMFNLDLQDSLPLLEIFKAEATVKDVTEQNGSVVIMLK
jgi:vacuolar-type H+-ATPase subunit H